MQFLKIIAIFSMIIFAPVAMAKMPAKSTVAQATMINNQGEMIGIAMIKKASNGVLIDLSVQGLEPGYHGMHFHNVGNCDDMDAFKNAGGHIMPTDKPHGFFHAQGPHEGNLPNLIVHKDGTAQVELYSNLVQFDEGPAPLLDEDGSTLIIHENRDDHITQPIGGAGGRVACGVIKQLPIKTQVQPRLEKEKIHGGSR